VLKYKVEPYCIAADIYSNPQHPGRGGWTWYTGSASWAYKTAIENILGFTLNGSALTIAPHIPSDWQQFSITYRFGSATYHFHYHASATTPYSMQLVDDGQEHNIEIR
jgi:cellobiose phosphorylase